MRKRRIRNYLFVGAVMFLQAVNIKAQPGYFHTVTLHANTETDKDSEYIPESCLACDTVTNNSEGNAAKAIVTADSAKKMIEGGIGKNIKLPSERTKTDSKKSNEGDDILSFYEGASHPLTIGNVLKVMEEVGISNQLFVLAQSLLETGFYKSNVCLTKNNLFGLRLRSGAYMHFTRWEDSVIGYYRYIQYRYKGGSYLSFLRRIGYAEDPHYISKVIKMARWIKGKYGE